MDKLVAEMISCVPPQGYGEKRTMNDLINREDAIKHINSLWKEFYKTEEWDDYDFEHNTGFCGGLITAMNSIKTLPSADRPQGEWKSVKASIYPYGYDVECSVCGFRMGSSFGYKYCPNCGARMKGADDETD